MPSTWWAGRWWPGEQEDAGLVGRKIRFLIWTKLWTLHLNEVPTLADSALGIECEGTKTNEGLEWGSDPIEVMSL